MEQIPYIAYESAMSRLERNIKRLWILCIILIGLLCATNAGWLWYESQYEYYEITQDTNEGGYNNFIGNNGDINNGKTDD